MNTEVDGSTFFPYNSTRKKNQLIMDILPRHWSGIDEVTDLADATQIEIATRNLTFAPIKPKPLPKPETERKPRGTPPNIPNPKPRTEFPPRADDSHRTSMPTPYTTSRDFCIHVKAEARNGKTRAQLKNLYSTPIGQGCWLCRFKQEDVNFHLDTACNVLNNVFVYDYSLDTYSTTLSPPAAHQPHVIFQ